LYQIGSRLAKIVNVIDEIIDAIIEVINVACHLLVILLREKNV